MGVVESAFWERQVKRQSLVLNTAPSVENANQYQIWAFNRG